LNTNHRIAESLEESKEQKKTAQYAYHYRRKNGYTVYKQKEKLFFVSMDVHNILCTIIAVNIIIRA